MAVWPVGIPFFQGSRAARIQVGKGAYTESKMAVGPPKRRRRTSSNPSTRRGRIHQLTLSQLLTFRAFFSDTLGDGTLTFTATDPYDDQVKTFAFVDGYTEQKVGAGYDITATLEIRA